MPWPAWRTPAPHGTDRRYQWHRYHGEEPCQLCREGHARDMRFRYADLRAKGYVWDEAANRYVRPEAAAS